MDYARDALEAAHAKNLPIFLFSFTGQLSHDDINLLQNGAQYYPGFFRDLMDRDLLNNSILFVMGDHGFRMGEVRETRAGWYEDRLPNMWIRLAPNLRDKYPEWEQALAHNSRYT